MDSSDSFVLLTGNSHPELANLIAGRMGIKLANCDVTHNSNRETIVSIKDSVRAKDVYIIQTGSMDCNNSIMEMLILAYACKTSSAKSIVGVIPYLPYSKQCKMRKRGCIVTKLLAKMLCKAGFTHFITLDLHQKEIQGFFDVPIDNLRASPFFLQYIQECIPDYKNAVIVARNPASAKKAYSYAEKLRVGFVVIHGGGDQECDLDEVDGRYSPPNVPRSKTMDVGIAVPPSSAAEKTPPLIGDVGGRIAIMVEDMIDDATSFVTAAEILKERGACKIYIMATHGLLSADAPRLLDASPIDEVVVTNTVPHEFQKLQCHKIKTLDISVLLSEAIRRIHHNESMSYLFQNVTLED